MGMGGACVERAGAVGAEFAVPAVTIPCDPGVSLASGKMNSRDQQEPCEEFPARKCETNARPGVHAGVNFSARANRLHQAQGFFAVHLGKARGNAWLVHVQEFNAATVVDPSHARHARTAQATGAIIEDC